MTAILIIVINSNMQKNKSGDSTKSPEESSICKYWSFINSVLTYC